MAEVAELELTAQERVRSLVGCGVQFNQHVFAAITGAPKERFPDLEDKVLRLAPQFVRLFFHDKQASAAPDKRESFVRTAKLAQQAGATINITWQSGDLVTPEARAKSMSRFADVLDELVTTHDVGSLRWVTIHNEPNTLPEKNPKTGKVPEKKVTPERLDDMYERLDKLLTNKGLRRQIRFMGGDLIRTRPDNQKLWFDHMAKNLAEFLDAYSVHIYFDYFDTGKFEERLREVRRFVNEMDESKRRPLFITEYGVRGKNRPPNPGIFDDGTPKGRPLSETNVAAFQQAWFLIRAMQLGYVGTIKWDCFHGKYDPNYTASHYVIGPGREGWPLSPMYFLLRLITMTTEAGWSVVEVKQNQPSAATKQLVALKGRGNQLTILGLDSRGRLENGVSSRQVAYTIGGLRPNATFTLVLWNRGGGGQLLSGGTITANGDGVARLTVPLHAVFALTTKTVSP